MQTQCTRKIKVGLMMERYTFEFKKSRHLGLDFPYDWSNPNIPDDALILNVLDRGFFTDICRICSWYGIERVKAVNLFLENDKNAEKKYRHMLANLPPEEVVTFSREATVLAVKTRQRMLSNIERGFLAVPPKASAATQPMPDSDTI